MSADKFTSSHKGRLFSWFGKTASNMAYGGETIFVDHTSGFIHIEHQVSLSAGDTIRSKRSFERLLYNHGMIVKAHHADNGVFSRADF